DACHEFPQLGHRDRLRQITVGAHAHAQLDVFFRPFGADYYYWQVLPIQFRPHPTDKLEAVHIRHPDVCQDEVELSVPHLIKRVLAVDSLCDVGLLDAIQPGKAHTQQLPERGRIIYNEKCFPTHLASLYLTRSRLMNPSMVLSFLSFSAYNLELTRAVAACPASNSSSLWSSWLNPPLCLSRR